MAAPWETESPPVQDGAAPWESKSPPESAPWEKTTAATVPTLLPDSARKVPTLNALAPNVGFPDSEQKKEDILTGWNEGAKPFAFDFSGPVGGSNVQVPPDIAGLSAGQVQQNLAQPLSKEGEAASNLAAGGAEGLQDLVNGVAGFFTSGKGLAQLGAAATPIAPAVYAKWAYDMAKAGYGNAQDAVDDFKKEDWQKFGKDTVSAFGSFLGAKGAAGHGVGILGKKAIGELPSGISGLGDQRGPRYTPVAPVIAPPQAPAASPVNISGEFARTHPTAEPLPPIESVALDPATGNPLPSSAQVTLDKAAQRMAELQATERTPNATRRISSPTSVSEPEIRTRVGQEAPPQQQGETPGAPSVTPDVKGVEPKSPEAQKVEPASKDWRVTVQSPVELAPGNKMPGYIQIDDVAGGKNNWSKNPDSLRKEGHDIPDFSKLPQGQYTFEEAVKKLGEIEANLTERGYRDLHWNKMTPEEIDAAVKKPVPTQEQDMARQQEIQAAIKAEKDPAKKNELIKSTFLENELIKNRNKKNPGMPHELPSAPKPNEIQTLSSPLQPKAELPKTTPGKSGVASKYPERPNGETEKEFQERIKGRDWSQLTLSDAERARSYQYLAGGKVREVLNASEISTPKKLAEFHRKEVKAALESGKFVPPEVLKDYPDLQPSAPKPSEPIPAAVGASPTPEQSSVAKELKHGDVYEGEHGGKKVWLIREGRKDGFGDSIWKTKEEADKYAEIVKQRAKDAKESGLRAEVEKAKQLEIEKEKRDFNGFESDKTPMQVGRLVSALSDRQVNWNGKISSRRDAIRRLVSEGRKVDVGPNGKRRLIDSEGRFFGEDQVSKLGMDYAEHLIRERNKTSTEKPSEAAASPESNNPPVVEAAPVPPVGEVWGGGEIMEQSQWSDERGIKLKQRPSGIRTRPNGQSIDYERSRSITSRNDAKIVNENKRNWREYFKKELESGKPVRNEWLRSWAMSVGEESAPLMEKYGYDTSSKPWKGPNDPSQILKPKNIEPPALGGGAAPVPPVEPPTPPTPPAPPHTPMGAATPAEFEHSPQTPTGIKNATVDLERSKRGLPPAMQAAKRSFGEVWDQAMAVVDRDPGAQDNLIHELRMFPRSLTDLEDALVLHRQIDLQNEYGKATRDLAQAFDDGRDESVIEEKARVARISDQLQDIYDIGKRSGTETARGLNARKMMAYEDFSLANMELQKRAANDGKPLTDAQRAEITELHKKLAETQKAFDDYVAKTEAAEAARAANEAIDEIVKNPKKKTVSNMDTAERTADLTDKIREKVEGGKKNEITSLVQKLARHFVENGITERDALIDAVHEVLKTIDPEFSRRKTMDAISGYGDFKQFSKDEISVKLRDLKGQMQQIAKLEDMQAGKPPLKTGLERRIPSKEESRLIKLVNDAKQQFQIPISDPNTQLKSSLDTLKTRLRNRIDELQQKLDTNDFTTKKRRELKLDAEAMRLKAKVENVKESFQRALMADKLSKRTTWEKAQDTFVKWRRAFILSGPITLAKLASAAIERVGFSALEEGIGGVMSKLPGIREVAKRAPSEGGFSVKAEAKAITEGLTAGMKDAWSVLKTGRSELDALYGKRDIMPRSAIDFFGNLHGSVKAPVKRAAFAKSLEKRVQHAIANGIDPTDPMVQIRLATEAYKDSNRSIFMQDNRVVDAYKRAMSRFSQVDKATGKVPFSSKLVTTTAKALLPIVKIPTNIVAETFQYATGTVTGSVRLASAFRKGIDTLPPEHADLIMRELKKGSLGAAVLLLGYLSADSVGGYYQAGQKRDPKDVGYGKVRVFGHDIPSYLVHNPLLEVLQLGATIRRVSDAKIHKKDAEAQGLGVGLMAGALGLTEEVPFVREMMETSKAFKPGERGAFFGELGKSMLVPQILQWEAQREDKDAQGNPIKRTPGTFTEYIKTGIPGLRQTVPSGKPKRGYTALP